MLRIKMLLVSTIVAVALAGVLLLPSPAPADVALSNGPIVADSGPACCYTDFFVDPEQCEVSEFTFPSGLWGVVRSSVHPSFFGGVGVNYQIAVTGGSGSVVGIDVPLFDCPLQPDFCDGGHSMHALRCDDPENPPLSPCIVSDATGLDDIVFAGTPSPLGPRVDCYPTAGTIPFVGTPISSSITDLSGGVYSTGFAGLPTGTTSRIFGVLTTGTPVLTTATLTSDSGETTTVVVKGCNTPPVADCVESVNPSGKKVPPAGSTTLPGPKGGQSEDGFYELISEDAEDGTAPLFVTNASGSATFGPFPSGSVVKITEATGKTPVSKPMGGPGSAVVAHITLDSDASVFAVDGAGAVSSEVSCLVPRPPK